MKTKSTANKQENKIINQNLSTANLEIINGISFTNREIEIIACLISGRSNKKIASLLSISYKTVEMHICNIMKKIECNSRECIIDFIEKSDKFNLIKAYYSIISLNLIFEKILKRLSHQIKEKKLSCLIIHYETEKIKTSFVSKIEKHLKLAGINIISKKWIKDKTKNLINSTKQDNIIYIISDELLEKLKSIEYKIEDEVANSIQSQNSIIFMFLNNKIYSELNPKLNDYTCINFTEQQNYYFTLFKLLKKISPNIDIEKATFEFKTQYDALSNPFDIKIEPNKNKPKNNNLSNKIFLSIPKLLTVGISLIIICLGLVFLNTNKILSFQKSKTLEETSLHKDNLQPINTLSFSNLPPRNIYFAGREASLEQLAKNLTNAPIGTTTHIIAGCGGIGKTQLSAEFAYRAMEGKKYSASFWVQSETLNTINSSYKEIANYLKININGLNSNEIQTIIHDHLAHQYQNSNVLFILDNVPDYEYIAQYLSKLNKDLSPFIKYHVIITSRSQNWMNNLIMLDTFTEEEAVEFTQKHLPHENAESIKKLNSTLHFYPLAISQAVSYIKTHTNIVDYLDLYADKQISYLDKFTGDKNQYNETLWKTWNISLNKLSNAANEILFISSYLYPDNIPFSFFTNLPKEKRLNAIEELRKYSLITPIDNESFKIHRLLQEVIRLNRKPNKILSAKHLFFNLLKNDDYWLSKTIELSKDHFAFDYINSEKWKYHTKFLPHIQTIINHSTKSSGATFEEGINLYIKYAMFLTHIQYEAKDAVIAWNKIKYLIKTSNKRESIKFINASINSHLSWALVWSKRIQDGKDLLEKSVLVQKGILPKLQKNESDRLDLLRIIPLEKNISDKERMEYDLSSTLNALGFAQLKLGLMHEASMSYHEAHNIIKNKKLTDKSKEYKFDALHDIGRLERIMGNFLTAEKIYKQIRQDINANKIYLNDIDKFSHLINFGDTMYQIGKFKEAKNLLTKSNETIYNLSPKHIFNIETNLSLGFINYMLGDLKSAEKNFKFVQELSKLYDDNMSYEISSNLGLWKLYESSKKHEKAIYHLEKAVNFANLRYKHNKKNINEIMFYELTQAEIWPTNPKNTNTAYLKKSLKAVNYLFGENNYQTAKYHYLLGQILESENKLKDAHKHYQTSLKILKVQKIGHPNLQQFFDKNTNNLQNALLRTKEHLS